MRRGDTEDRCPLGLNWNKQVQSILEEALMPRKNGATIDDAYEIRALEAMWRRARGELLAQQLSLDRADP